MIHLDEGVNEEVTEGAKKALDFIRSKPLCRVPAIVKGTGMPGKTIERCKKKLRDLGMVEFRRPFSSLTLTLFPHGARELVLSFLIFPRHHEVGERGRVRGL